MTEDKPSGYGSRYRVTAFFVGGKREHSYARTKKEVRDLEFGYHHRGCCGLQIEKFVPGIGYVLHEGNHES